MFSFPSCSANSQRNLSPVCKKPPFFCTRNNALRIHCFRSSVFSLSQDVVATYAELLGKELLNQSNNCNTWGLAQLLRSTYLASHHRKAMAASWVGRIVAIDWLFLLVREI